MNDVSKRFLDCYQELKEQKIISDKREFSKLIGVSSSLITEIEKDRTNVGVLAIQNTVLIFNINPEWILTGKGNMFKNGADEKNHLQKNKIPKENESTLILRDLLKEKEEKLAELYIQIGRLEATVDILKTQK